ncbi:regulator [Vibrio cionasavignyae]|uniref:regulator n=1 Tax=Vibrio cionasavignyae TaxID=2910252 RepID=UPI003D126ACC
MRFNYNDLNLAQKHKTLKILDELDVESVAKLCFKTVKTVEKWKHNGCIPPEYIRLIRMHHRKELSSGLEWQGFYIEGGKLRLPTGQMIGPQQLVLAVALLELGAKPELVVIRKIRKVALALNSLRTPNRKT